MDHKTIERKKTGPLPPLPELGPLELVYGADPITGRTGAPVGALRSVSVPIERIDEYFKHYGLELERPIDIPGGPVVLVLRPAGKTKAGR